MTVKTKRVYEPLEPSDGFRLLVMRLWPRGVSKGAVHAWEPDLGPSRDLLTAYRRGKVGWEEFARRYTEEVRDKPDILKKVQSLEEEHGQVTLLCSCPQEGRCHRGVLKGLLEARPLS